MVIRVLILDRVNLEIVKTKKRRENIVILERHEKIIRLLEQDNGFCEKFWILPFKKL